MREPSLQAIRAGISLNSKQRQEMLSYWPPSLVDGALDAWAKMVTEPELVSPTVEEVTGAAARTFREWAIDHAGDFR